MNVHNTSLQMKQVLLRRSGVNARAGVQDTFTRIRLQALVDVPLRALEIQKMSDKTWRNSFPLQYCLKVRHNTPRLLAFFR